MAGRVRVTQEASFYKEFSEMNPALLMLFTLVTLGFYVIVWIFTQNKVLVRLDEDAPDPNRGAFTIFLIPAVWFCMTYVMRELFYLSGILYEIMEGVVWAIIFALIVKYVFDFCKSFGKITKSSTIIWFLFILIGMIGIYGVTIRNPYIIPFAFFLVITIPAMQANLNKYIASLKIKKRERSFYDV